MKEIYYDYKSFDSIKNFIHPNTIYFLDNRTDFFPNRHTNPNWGGEHYLDDNGYLITTKIFSDEIKLKNNLYFTYKINSHGFRSKHFKTLNSKKTNFLFAGCSFTFGEGMPEDLTWTSMVEQKVKKTYGDNFEFFNIGFGGASPSLIVKNIMAFIRLFGKPDYLLVLLPDVARNILFSEEFNSYMKAYFSSEHLKSKISKTSIKYVKNFVYEDSILTATEAILMLHNFCKEANIELIWSTWDYNMTDVYLSLEINTFIKPDSSFVLARRVADPAPPTEPYYENIDNLPYWEVARDDSHPGSCYSIYQSDKYFNEVSKRFLKKETV